MDTLSFNRSYVAWKKWGFAPTLYACLDPIGFNGNALEIRDLIREKPATHFFLADSAGSFGIASSAQVSHVRMAPGCKFGTDISTLTDFGNVGATSLQILGLLGYRRIAMVGVDARYGHIDYKAVADEDGFILVDAIRDVENSLGVPEKRISQGELNNRLSLAKSLVAATDLPGGRVLVETDFDVRSPAKGISPLKVYELLGKKVASPMKKGDYFSTRSIETDRETEPWQSYAVPRKWGIVGRLNDFQDYLDMRPDLVEMHMTWRDIDGYRPLEGLFDQDLVVHAPEYYQDTLIDFSSDDSSITDLSLTMLQRTINIARDLAPHFAGQKDSRGPRVVVHPGGHFPTRTDTIKAEQYRRLMHNLKSIDTEGVRVLVENMPPFPWYFGGQWTNTIFLDPGEIAQFAKVMNWGICYDTSHAQLFCCQAGISILEFTKKVLDHVHYLHISDARGVTHEGLQIGEGEIDFQGLFALLAGINPGFIPEIWQGHLDNGRGFRNAMKNIKALLDKSSGDSCSCREGEFCSLPDHGMAAVYLPRTTMLS